MVVASGVNVFAKEMSIRKRIASIYNKREDDFPSLREYNDYLEEVEDMIINLVEGIDVPAIEARIAEYQRENAEQIMNAQARKAEEYATALAASKGQLQPTSIHLDIRTGKIIGRGTEDRGLYYVDEIAQKVLRLPSRDEQRSPGAIRTCSCWRNCTASANGHT